MSVNELSLLTICKLNLEFHKSKNYLSTYLICLIDAGQGGMVNEAISQDHNIPARFSSNIAKTIVCQRCDSRHRCSRWRISRSCTYFYRAITAKIALHAFTDPCRYKRRFRLQYFILYLIHFSRANFIFQLPAYLIRNLHFLSSHLDIKNRQYLKWRPGYQSLSR